MIMIIIIDRTITKREDREGLILRGDENSAWLLLLMLLFFFDPSSYWKVIYHEFLLGPCFSTFISRVCLSVCCPCACKGFSWDGGVSRPPLLDTFQAMDGNYRRERVNQFIIDVYVYAQEDNVCIRVHRVPCVQGMGVITIKLLFLVFLVSTECGVYERND